MTHDEMVVLWEEYKRLSLSSDLEDRNRRYRLGDELAEELDGDALSVGEGKIVVEYDGSLFEANLR